MKNVIKKVMSVMLVFALAVTINVGAAGRIPRNDNGGVSTLSDEPSPIAFQY